MGHLVQPRLDKNKNSSFVYSSNLTRVVAAVLLSCWSSSGGRLMCFAFSDAHLFSWVETRFIVNVTIPSAQPSLTILL